jgi:hypothetical protein
MMKWVLSVIGGIAAIIVVIALIGLMLPRDHVATRTARYKASPDSIWAARGRTSCRPTEAALA